MYLLILAALLTSAPDDSPAAGQAALPPALPPTAEAWPSDQEPTLDGRVLDDPVWQGVPEIRGFWQTTPEEGKPASEETVVRILYTPSTLYVGVVCYDRRPSGIIIAGTRRDSSLEDTDSFQMILDTYRDLQNGYVFGTNPAGLEYDGHVTREGQGTTGLGGQTGGSGGGFNVNWDAVWEVRAVTGDFGWSAEFAIPFRSLRFRPGEEQNWGLNFQRNIRRRHEVAFWAPLPRQFNLYRLSLAGTLNGLRPPRMRNLKLTPYVLGESRHDRLPSRTNWLLDGGFDVKYNVTPTLTLDGTYNTDFAQVEVDEQQINLDRFNLFFPEKRPFFLENAGFFSVGSPGEVELFFSRRIGISESGEVIPIQAGGRLSGRLGDHYNLGLLNMQTQEVEGVAAANNFTVVRLSRELPNRSNLGGIFINRSATGGSAEAADFNRTFAVDGKWGLGEYGEVSGFAAGTAGPDSGHEEYAWRLGGLYDSRSWYLTAGYTEVGEGFNPEVGFLEREGYRKVDWMVMHRIRPQDFIGILELRPHASYRGYWNFEGFQETGHLHMDNHWQWRSGAEIHTGLNLTREGVVTPFEIFPGVVVPPGTYDHAEAQLVAFTNEGAWVSARVDSRIGGFFGGDRVRLEPSLRLRAGEKVNLRLTWSRNDIDLPWGSFQTNLGRLRVSYSLNPRVFFQALVQYNDRADLWSANLRFGWLQSGNTGLFVVYNDTRGLDSLRGEGDRSLTVKFSRTFDLLD